MDEDGEVQIPRESVRAAIHGCSEGGGEAAADVEGATGIDTRTESRLVSDFTSCRDYRSGEAHEAQTGHAQSSEHEVNSNPQDHPDMAFEGRTYGAALSQNDRRPKPASQPERLSTCGQSVGSTFDAHEVTNRSCDTDIRPATPIHRSVDATVDKDQHAGDLSVGPFTADESLSQQIRSGTVEGLDTGHTQITGTHRGHAPESFDFGLNRSSREQAVPQLPMSSGRGTAISAGQGLSQTTTTTPIRPAVSMSDHLDAAAGTGHGDPALVSPMNQQSDSDFAALWSSSITDSEGLEQAWDEWLPDIFDLSFLADLPSPNPTIAEGTKWDR